MLICLSVRLNDSTQRLLSSQVLVRFHSRSHYMYFRRARAATHLATRSSGEETSNDHLKGIPLYLSLCLLQIKFMKDQRPNSSAHGVQYSRPGHSAEACPSHLHVDRGPNVARYAECVTSKYYLTESNRVDGVSLHRSRF